MSWIGDKAEATANVLKDLLTQTPAAKLYRQGLPNVLDALLDTREEEWRAKVQAMPKPFDASPEAINRDMESAMAFWNPAGMVGKIVYHGSPHKFDKFDASKIGTGEGAQAYGHGVYLADAEDVAKGYRRELSNQIRVNKDGYFAKSKADGKEYGPFQSLKDAFAGVPQDSGALYKADLPDEWIPKMLDWDKPLSQQSKEAQQSLAPARKWLSEMPGFTEQARASFSKGTATAKDLHNALVGELSKSGDKINASAASEYLQSVGIPGIRYLDGGSRPNGGRISMLEQTIANLKGKGASQAAIANTQRELDAELARASYNYVVFPGMEDKVKILERNGQPVNMIADALMRSRR